MDEIAALVVYLASEEVIVYEVHVRNCLFYCVVFSLPLRPVVKLRLMEDGRFETRQFTQLFRIFESLFSHRTIFIIFLLQRK